MLGVVTILGGIYRDRPQLMRTGRRYVFVLVAAVAAFVDDGVGALLARLLDPVRRRQRRARDARAVHVHRRLVGARGVDPLVGARIERLPRDHRVAVPRRGASIRSSRGRPSSGSVSRCSSSR